MLSNEYQVHDFLKGIRTSTTGVVFGLFGFLYETVTDSTLFGFINLNDSIGIGESNDIVSSYVFLSTENGVLLFGRKLSTFFGVLSLLSTMFSSGIICGSSIPFTSLHFVTNVEELLLVDSDRLVLDDESEDVLKLDVDEVLDGAVKLVEILLVLGDTDDDVNVDVTPGVVEEILDLLLVETLVEGLLVLVDSLVEDVLVVEGLCSYSVVVDVTELVLGDTVDDVNVDVTLGVVEEILVANVDDVGSKQAFT